MITKRDCILLLSELKARGIPNVQEMLNKAIRCNNIDMSVIKFINEHRQFEANAFYEKLRHSYNAKKSTLYKNIVTCDEVDCTSTVLTTLSALNLQIYLYAQHLEDPKLFLRHTRVEEIAQVLMNYAKTYDLIPCMQVLQLVKADLKAFEMLNNK